MPATLVEVKDSEPFELNVNHYLDNLQLLAMKRDEFNKRAKGDPKLSGFKDNAEGVAAADLPSPATTVPSTAKEAPVTSYRVQFKNGKLTVEDLGENEGVQVLSGAPPLWVVGIVGSLHVVIDDEAVGNLFEYGRGLEWRPAEVRASCGRSCRRVAAACLETGLPFFPIQVQNPRERSDRWMSREGKWPTSEPVREMNLSTGAAITTAA